MQSNLSYSTLSTHQHHEDASSDSGSSSHGAYYDVEETIPGTTDCVYNNTNTNNDHDHDDDQDDGGGNYSIVSGRSTGGGAASIAASPYWAIPSSLAKTAATPVGFSPFVAFCFTINYILGTGFLTVPWAFVQSGLVLSTILMIASAIASDIAKDFMLETMARAEAMLDNDMHWRSYHSKGSGGGGAKSTTKNQPKDGNKQHQPAERVLLVPPKRLRQEREKLLALHGGGGQSSDYNSIESTTMIDHAASNGGDTHNHHAGNNPTVVRSSSLPMMALVELHNGKATAESNNIDAPDIGVHHLPHQVVTVREKAPPKYVIQERKFEVNALCRVFLGKGGLRMYTVIICLYICGALWAYTSVFSSAMAAAVPLFDSTEDNNGDSMSYLCYAILFGCVVVPLSCLELDEQVPLQVLLTGCRFVMFLIMISTSHLCAEDMRVANGSIGPDSLMSQYERVEYFRPAGLANTLPILIFANIFHHSIPGLAHPVADKKLIGKVFSSTNAFTVAAYIALGLTLGSAFGKSVEQSSNLNWSTFHAGTGHIDEFGNVVGAAWWTKLVSNYVIMFPAVDVVSAFPLNAITLGNNLLGAVYGKRIHEVEKNRLIRTAFRLLASIPPIVFGILVRELGVITDYTGTTGFLIGLCIPAILYMSSKAIAAKKNFATDTHYTSYGSTTTIARLMLWFGGFMTFGVFMTLTFFSRKN